MKKGLKHYSEFSDNPFLEDEEVSDISKIILNLSKAALELMYYIFDTKSFTEDRFIFDIDEFKRFANKKSDTSAIQSLRELCFVGVIAKTKISRVYWVNKNVFLDNKAMGYLKDLLNSKKKNKQK
ncbi:hypothetical protein ACRRVB_00770 [Candidatus Cardinium hertigii]|uniref:hypothetical protein n=1 Tax=Candidatus Cardinium hertigii TaxID=247481 RepID=UPI003D7E6AEB